MDVSRFYLKNNSSVVTETPVLPQSLYSRLVRFCQNDIITLPARLTYKITILTKNGPSRTNAVFLETLSCSLPITVAVITKCS